jgi:hypothetical protein
VKTAAFLIAGTLVLSGCSSTGSTSSPLIADKVIKLTADTTIKLSSIATAAAIAVAIYVVYDPLAPNWEIEESRLNDTTYRLSMKMKRYHTGGAGESIQLLKRRASTKGSGRAATQRRDVRSESGFCSRVTHSPQFLARIYWYAPGAIELRSERKQAVG